MEDKLDIVIKLLTEINNKLPVNLTLGIPDLPTAIKPKKLTEKQSLMESAKLLADQLTSTPRSKRRAAAIYQQIINS